MARNRAFSAIIFRLFHENFYGFQCQFCHMVNVFCLASSQHLDRCSLGLFREMFKQEKFGMLRLAVTHITTYNQEPTETCKQRIRTHYLGHVTGYQPIRDQYFLIRSVPAYNNISKKKWPILNKYNLETVTLYRVSHRDGTNSITMDPLL
eukprot:sb/3473558/